MGKRSGYPRREADFYPTPAKAVLPLVPFLRGVRTFAEPCCGDGDLVRHLESHGLRCVYQGDIRTGQDALKLTAVGCNGADAGITNPPFKYPEDPPRTTRLMRDLIRHFLDIGVPFWLLLPHDWSANKGSAPYLRHCSDIVVVGRVQWMPNSKHKSGMENAAWYRFDANHTTGPIFHARNSTPAASISRPAGGSDNGKNGYHGPRGTSRQYVLARLAREGRADMIAAVEEGRLSVRAALRQLRGKAASGSEQVFRYVQHADVQKFLSEGWEALSALEGTHHGEYSMLMRLKPPAG